MTARTPTPWILDDAGRGLILSEDSGTLVADAQVAAWENLAIASASSNLPNKHVPIARANAEFIVKACNAHDALVHALALVIESYEAGDGAMATKQVIDHVRSILATQRVTP